MAVAEMVVQCNLSAGTSRLTAFVPVQPGLRVGAVITLKDSDTPDTLWTVEAMGQPLDRSVIKRGWKNDI